MEGQHRRDRGLARLPAAVEKYTVGAGPEQLLLPGIGLDAQFFGYRYRVPLYLSREKILARYRGAAPEALKEVDGKKRRAVYNTLGVTVWPARVKGDPLKIMFSALGGEEVCHGDATSTR